MHGILAAAAIWAGACAAGGQPPADPAPESGWPRERVIREMGEPRGLIRDDSLEILHYDRGVVHLRDGLVVTAALVGSEEADRLRRERERLAAEAAKARAERRLRLYDEGLAERERLLADPRTGDLPPDALLRLWESFARRYPDVPVQSLVAVARARHELEEERREWTRRIAQLEARVAEAERRARNASGSCTGGGRHGPARQLPENRSRPTPTTNGGVRSARFTE